MLEKLSLEDKTIVITGGGTGLGKEMCLAMARAGANLVIAARRLEPIEEVSKLVQGLGRRSLAISTDATNTSDIKTLFDTVLKEFGKVDVLINNAGIVREDSAKPIWEITDESWNRCESIYSFLLFQRDIKAHGRQWWRKNCARILRFWV